MQDSVQGKTNECLFLFPALSLRGLIFRLQIRHFIKEIVHQPGGGFIKERNSHFIQHISEENEFAFHLIFRCRKDRGQHPETCEKRQQFRDFPGIFRVH